MIMLLKIKLVMLDADDADLFEETYGECFEVNRSGRFITAYINAEAFAEHYQIILSDMQEVYGIDKFTVELA
jgi:hypothetical protein